MKTELRNRLHEFLEPERISPDSGIVNYITYLLAGIQVSSNPQNHGFKLSKYDPENLVFKFPPEFGLEEADKIFQLFSYNKVDYKLGKSIELDDTYIFELFLPLFEAEFLKLMQTNSEIIQEFRIKSAPLLENAAIETLKQYIEEINAIVMKNPLENLSQGFRKLTKTLILLNGHLKYLEHSPLFYLDILASGSKINGLLDSPELRVNPEIFSKLTTVLQGIELFGRYHRIESVIHLLKFKKDIDVFLLDYRITSQACDIVEHSILNLAGITWSERAEFRYIIGVDKSRFVLHLKDFSQENTEKLVTYLKSIGDDTACQGYGNRHFSTAISEDKWIPQRALVSNGTPALEKVQPIEKHSIEMDGTFFNTILYPLIQQHIHSMSDELLVPYQAASLDALLERAVKCKSGYELIKVSSITMFDKNTLSKPGTLVPETNFSIQ